MHIHVAVTLSVASCHRVQDPVRECLMRRCTSDARALATLESRLDGMVRAGCAAGGAAVAEALLAASSTGCEILISSLLRSVLCAVCATL